MMSEGDAKVLCNEPDAYMSIKITNYATERPHKEFRNNEQHQYETQINQNHQDLCAR